MKYKSPLFIVPEKEVDKINETYLKRLRKELMLRFDLSKNSTIELNGREYDKTSILEAIGTLEQGADHHIRLFNNRDLLRFIEKGDIVFNKNPESWEDLEDQEFREWIRPYFTEQYGKLMYNIVSKKGFASLNKLRLLNESGFQLPVSYEDEAYASAYRFFEKMFEEFKNEYANPFIKARKITFKPGVQEHCNIHYQHVLENLPTNFDGLKHQYWKQLRELVYKAFKDDIYFVNIEKTTLRELKRISEMCLALNEETEVERLLGDINDYLNGAGGDGGATDFPIWKAVLYAVIFIVFIVRILTLGESCNRSTSSSSFDNTTYELSKNKSKLTEIQRARSRKNNEKSLPNNLTAETLIGHWNQSSSYRKEGHMLTRKVEFLNNNLAVIKYVIDEKSSDHPCVVSATVSWKLEKKWLLFTYDDNVSVNCPVRSSGGNGGESLAATLKADLQGASEKESVVRIINNRTLHTQHHGPLFDDTPLIYKKEE